MQNHFLCQAYNQLVTGLAEFEAATKFAQCKIKLWKKRFIDIQHGTKFHRSTCLTEWGCSNSLPVRKCFNRRPPKPWHGLAFSYFVENDFCEAFEWVKETFGTLILESSEVLNKLGNEAASLQCIVYNKYWTTWSPEVAKINAIEIICRRISTTPERGTLASNQRL